MNKKIYIALLFSLITITGTQSVLANEMSTSTTATSTEVTGSHLRHHDSAQTNSISVGGTVVSVDGNTLTLNVLQKKFAPINKGSSTKARHTFVATPVTYTVDISNAVLTKITDASAPVTISVNDIQKSARLIVHGTHDGLSITASKVVEMVSKKVK